MDVVYSLSEIQNSVVNVKDADAVSAIKRISGKGHTKYQRFGDLTGNTSENIFSYAHANPIIVDSLEFSTNNSSNVSIDISTRSSTGTLVPIYHLSADGTGHVARTIFRIAEEGSQHFDLYVYDTEKSKFKIALKEPLVLPNGGSISIKNESATTFKIGVQAIVREF